MKTCWIPINPDTSGNYLATPGNHYAVLLSVDSRASMKDVTDELNKNELSVIYGWQSGQQTRKRFAIDRWLEMLPPPADGTVWMYFELAYTGSTPKTLARHVEKCVLFICGSVDITYAFEAQQKPDDYAPCSPGESGGASIPPPCPQCPRPNTMKPFLVGAGIGGSATLAAFWLWKVFHG
jgi:hypothetical protein